MRVQIWFSLFTGIVLLVCLYVAIFYVNDTGRERLGSSSVPRPAAEAEAKRKYKPAAFVKSTTDSPVAARKLHTLGTGKNKMSRRFPDGIVIGVQKGGTRALLEMLSSHPNCVKTAEAEIDFFSSHYERGLKWYIRQMPLAIPKNVVIEKSPSYFHSSQAPERIHAQGMPVKLILTVRNPIDRAVSAYLQIVDKYEPDLPKFEELVISNQTGEVNINGTKHSGIISQGLYDIHYQKWLQWFNKSQILVLDGEVLVKDPVSILNKAEQFLGLKKYFNRNMFIHDKSKPGFFCWVNPNSGSKKCLGKSKGRPHPRLKTSVVKKLNQFYRSHIANFCHLASVAFPWCTM